MDRMCSLARGGSCQLKDLEKNWKRISIYGSVFTTEMRPLILSVGVNCGALNGLIAPGHSVGQEDIREKGDYGAMASLAL
jgi:hypothetical protein